MHLLSPESGLWYHETGWSLKSGQICKKNYWCIQIVVLRERWSLNSGVSDDRFYCTTKRVMLERKSEYKNHQLFGHF